LANGGVDHITRALESRPFLDSITEGLVVHGLDGRIVDANQAASTLLGLTRDQLLGRISADPRWHSIRRDGSEFPPDEHPAMVSLHTHEPCCDVVMGIDRPGAQITWIKINAYPLMIQHRFVGVSALLADLTGEINLSRDLAATAERLKILVDNAADVVILHSPSGVVEWISSSVVELLGWPPERFVGQRVEDFIHPDDVTEGYVQRAPNGAAAATFLLRLRQGSGAYRWISASIRGYVNADTGMAQHVASWRDAQVLVETRNRLETSESRYRFLAENASDVVCEMDAHFVVTWISPSVTELLGWRTNEIIGRTLADFVVPEDQAMVRYERASVLAGEKPKNLKIRYHCADGSSRWMALRARANRNADGVITSLVVALRDIHEEEKVRKELLASEEKYRLLAENGADVVVLLDVNFTYQWVSPSSEDLIGWCPHEMVGRSARDFVHPDDFDLVVNVHRDFSEAHFSTATVRFRHPEGTYTWLSARGRDVYDQTGLLQSRIIALRDVNAQVIAERTLVESESRLRIILDNQSDVTAQVNTEAIIEWISPSVFALSGWRPEEVTGQPISDFVVTDDLHAFEKVVANVLAGNSDSYEARIRTSSGDERWVEARAEPLFDESGATVGSIINIRDVHGEHLVRAQLSLSEERFRRTIEFAPIAMAVVDLDRHVLEVNPALCAMLGRTEDWLLSRRIPDILDADDDELDLHMRGEALAGRVDTASREKRLRRSDGSIVWVEHSIGLLRGPSGEPQSYVSTFVDVTEAKSTQDKLHYQATHDTLTHLVNRRDLFHRAENLQKFTVRTGDRVGFLYIDVDDFKQVNDTQGHHVGDLTLLVVAQRLSSAGRDDDVVSRVGGDEFVILLPALHDVNDARHVAQKILDTFNEPIEVEGITIPLHVSIGVALAEPGEAPGHTMQRADHALYDAKAEGGARAATWQEKSGDALGGERPTPSTPTNQANPAPRR
jgi:diguanylate cyclase (GGDEF)-like protein/PAS domain S-box-containing protein